MKRRMDGKNGRKEEKGQGEKQEKELGKVGRRRRKKGMGESTKKEEEKGNGVKER
jgi:hypothetical protein